MLPWIAVALVILAAGLPLAGGSHAEEGCVPTTPSLWTVNEIYAWGADASLGQYEVHVEPETYYDEERNNPWGWYPPLPGSSLVLSFMQGQLAPFKREGGTWLYQESNGIDHLQRGGIGSLGTCFPPPPLLCVVVDQDPINDETCGHGPDSIMF